MISDKDHKGGWMYISPEMDKDIVKEILNSFYGKPKEDSMERSNDNITSKTSL